MTKCRVIGKKLALVVFEDIKLCSMPASVVEESYPISFRKTEAILLGKLIRQNDSVVLIGMKRVGISNFLRFFLNHKEINKKYIKNGGSHLFIPVDLNDLVSIDLYAFWILTLKRIVDATEKSNLSSKSKLDISKLFSESVQLKDLFITLDSVQKAIHIIQSEKYYPVLFFIRFDRLKDIVTTEFFANLQGLKDSSNHVLSYVFTSFKSLPKLNPQVFDRASLSTFSKNLYLPPANDKDISIILDTLIKRYNLNLSKEIKKELIKISGGHVQYLHLATIRIHENRFLLSDTKGLFTSLANDEEIRLQSEELYESLTKEEQANLLSKSHDTYLENTGILKNKKIFSPLFEYYLKSRTKNNNHKREFTKKENLLFTFLKENFENLCERDDIVEAVWPEYKEYGVTDWAIDRLISRVRNKLILQKSQYEIETVVTRGYKLLKNL